MDMHKIAAVVQLTRVEHSAMLVIAVLAAELLAGGFPGAVPLALSVVTPIFVSMASFAINDYFDIDVDRLNRKNRPLVNGSLKPSDAVYVAAVCFGIGIAAAALINAYAFAIAVAFAALAVLYSYRLKETFMLGNAYIALTMVIPFIFGNYVVNSELAGSVVLVSVMVFLSGFGREVHGTIRDYRGDVKARKVRTLPRVIGVAGSSFVALLLYAVAIAISFYLFLYTPPFQLNLVFGAMIFASDLLLVYVSVGYALSRKQAFYDFTRNISLLAMGLALIAILISAAMQA